MDDIKGRSAITILENYTGKNPYLKKLKLKLSKSGKLKLTANQTKYIINNHDKEPIHVNKVISITKESLNDMLKSIDTNGINKIIGKQVNSQHEIIFKNNINSTAAFDVKYISITPLLWSSLKKLLELSKVVSIAVIQITPGIISLNNDLSGPKTKGKIDIIRKKNISGKNILFKFLKYTINSFFIKFLIICVSFPF